MLEQVNKTGGKMMSEYGFTRRGFLKAAGLGALALSLQDVSVFAKKQNKPNILFIFADDQCFETLHSMGCDEIQTPNLDRLGKKLDTQYYVVGNLPYSFLH